MSITIKLNFPGGRYHATPWGRHVNEGVPEWPPSPWRLLRAIVAVWKRTCPEFSEAQIRRILETLSPPPRFHLPPHRVAHTRHAMPMNVIAKNYKPSGAERKAGKFQGDPSIVFDTFVCINRQNSLFISWSDANLSAQDYSLLEKLLTNLSSLGRAEGWVEAKLTDELPSWNCIPASETDLNPVPVFCPNPMTAFGDEHYPTDPKKPAKGKVKPTDFLFDCPRWHLCLDTETIHSKKWPTVPGAMWVNYTRPAEITSIPKTSKPTHRTTTVARFAIDGPVLPLVTDTLPLGESIRSALMGIYQRLMHKRKFGSANKPYQERFFSRNFSGKDEDAQPLRDNHRHAFFLPIDEDNDDRIDHITVVAEQGFTPDEVHVLDRLRQVSFGEGDPLRLMLVGLGTEGDFNSPLFAQSQDWVSATPFVVTRFPKLRGRKRDRPEDYATPREFARHVLHQELERLRERRTDLAELIRIEFLETLGPQKNLRPIQFARFRQKRGDDGGRRPNGAFRLVFAKPVRGPICLGHSCHFGLGLFLPEVRQKDRP